VLSCSVGKMAFFGTNAFDVNIGQKSHCRIPHVLKISIFFYIMKFYRGFSRSPSELQVHTSQIRGDFQSLVLLLN